MAKDVELESERRGHGEGHYVAQPRAHAVANTTVRKCPNGPVHSAAVKQPAAIALGVCLLGMQLAEPCALVVKKNLPSELAGQNSPTAKKNKLKQDEQPSGDNPALTSTPQEHSEPEPK